MNIILKCGIEKIETRVDGSLKVIIGTPEMDNEEAGRLFSFRRLEAFCLLSSEPITTEQKEIVTPLRTSEKPIEGKSPSQRLRSTIFVLWEQQGAVGEFDKFYSEKIEMVIDQVKEKLN